MTDKSEPGVIGVGMPHMLYLDQFGLLVYDAFGNYPYLVGSATVSKQWHDVDVRLILDDDDYLRLIGNVQNEAGNPRWRAFCMAFSELGKRLTGLPIDFQIQQQTQANRLFPHQRRQALILASDVMREAHKEGT